MAICISISNVTTRSASTSSCHMGVGGCSPDINTTLLALLAAGRDGQAEAVRTLLSRLQEMTEALINFAGIVAGTSLTQGGHM
jgi:hypothetical protein